MISPESLHATIERLRAMRQERVRAAVAPPHGSLVPFAECCAIDIALRVLEEKLREVAS